MKSFFTIILVFLVGFSLSGCHKMNVKDVSGKLRIGMSKEELNVVMKGEKFLREQIVQVHPGSTEQRTRAAVRNNRIYTLIIPKGLIDEILPFDGSVKAYSYLIKEERRFANPIDIEALFVFYDPKKDQVIGWADIGGLVEVRLWREVF